MNEDARFYRDPQGHPVVDCRFRVRYFETDAMGIVHHASYITWFEEGRSEYSRVLGYPYSMMEQEGVYLAVAEMHARYLQPARYDDEIIVATCLQECRSRAMTYSYEIRRASDGASLVTGSSKHIAVDREKRVIRFPASMLAKINPA
jgi:acyl-CoA thioester hydrolase